VNLNINLTDNDLATINIEISSKDLARFIFENKF